MAREYDPPPHQHTDACKLTTRTCGRAEHFHEAACFGPAGSLRCRETVHHHTSVCNTTANNCGFN